MGGAREELAGTWHGNYKQRHMAGQDNQGWGPRQDMNATLIVKLLSYLFVFNIIILDHCTHFQKLKVLFAVGTEGEVSEPLEVNTLTCDTIEQVKEKILQTFQRKFGFPYTQQLREIDIGKRLALQCGLTVKLY